MEGVATSKIGKVFLVRLLEKRIQNAVIKTRIIAGVKGIIRLGQIACRSYCTHL